MTQQTLFTVPDPSPVIKSARVNVVTVQLVKERSVKYDVERFTTPQQTAAAFRAMVGNPDREIMAILILNGKNQIQSIHQVSQGSLNQSIVHPREVFKAAILANAASIVLCHNHPSEDVSPSREDLAITKRLQEAGEILGIKVLDHVIVATESGDYRSFVESGLM